MVYGGSDAETIMCVMGLSTVAGVLIGRARSSLGEKMRQWNGRMQKSPKSRTESVRVALAGLAQWREH